MRSNTLELLMDAEIGIWHRPATELTGLAAREIIRLTKKLADANWLLKRIDRRMSADHFDPTYGDSLWVDLAFHIEQNMKPTHNTMTDVQIADQNGIASIQN